MDNLQKEELVQLRDALSALMGGCAKRILSGDSVFLSFSGFYEKQY